MVLIIYEQITVLVMIKVPLQVHTSKMTYYLNLKCIDVLPLS